MNAPTKRQRLSAAAAAASLQSCPTLCDPIDSSPPGCPVPGFSRQEHWSGCHFLLQCMKVKSESAVSQSCPTLCDPIDGSPPGSPSLGFSRQEHRSGLPFPSPMRQSEVAQLCPTLSDLMDCSLPGSSVHGIFQARVLEWGSIALSSHKG